MRLLKNQTIYFLLSVMLIIFTCCEKYNEQEKYKRPDWLPGKLYTTVAVQEELSLFTECLKLAGLDTILDVSGSWTVFAPDDEAVKRYLAEKNYADITQIPTDELERITEYHIVQNPWSLDQLQTLSAYGWRIGKYKTSDSYAYKRQTMFKNPVEKYWVHKKKNKKEVIVVDSTKAEGYKKVFVESRKNVPVFYDDYIDNNGLSSNDFSFYFDRPYEPGNVYFAGGKIIRSDIFAENGFVHIIDRMEDPLLNAQELLEKDYPGESYKLFLEMVYWYYPAFSPNMAATLNQPEIRYGGEIDTLYDLNYSRLPFALHRESTGYEGADVNQTLVRHNSLFVPTDEAFRVFIDGLLTSKSGYPHWPDHLSLPKDIADIIIAQNLKTSALYPSTTLFRDVFRVKGRYQQSENAIIRKEYGSNCTFIGLDAYIPDRVFTSVTRPVFCRPEYSAFRLALLYSGAVNTIANHAGPLMFFPIHDYALGADSSLMVNWINEETNQYNFREYNRMEKKMQSISSNAIRTRILNHVGTSMPNGSAEKEFIRTLSGNYLTWDHTNNTIRGAAPSTIGFFGYKSAVNSPVPIDEPADNGSAWAVTYWFKFGGETLKAVLSESPEFYNLLLKAGLVDDSPQGLNFIDENEKYTIFVPSDEAITGFKADNLSDAELGRVLKNHFIQGEIIFTDNKLPSGKYHTANGTTLSIETGPDIIRIPDINGKPYLTIPEKENKTNIMVTNGSEINTVVHKIDKMLISF